VDRELKILLTFPRSFCAGVDGVIEVVKKALLKHGFPDLISEVKRYLL
jgi:4-hydroxy-3-methylbut-2-enyl diphosphate reductase IspH